jgi:hypothetical protein
MLRYNEVRRCWLKVEKLRRLEQQPANSLLRRRDLEEWDLELLQAC